MITHIGSLVISHIQPTVCLLNCSGEHTYRAPINASDEPLPQACPGSSAKRVPALLNARVPERERLATRRLHQCLHAVRRIRQDLRSGASYCTRQKPYYRLLRFRMLLLLHDVLTRVARDRVRSYV